MKKFLSLSLAAVMAISLCACSFSTTTTTTTTKTDADGNTVTESVTTTNNNGKVTTTTRNYLTLSEVAEDGETHKVPLEVKNASDKYTITGLYVTKAGADSYDGNLIEGYEIKPDDTVTGLNLNYNKDEYMVCDIGILVDGEEEIRWFSDVDFGNDNSENLQIIFYDEGDGWTVEHY